MEQSIPNNTKCKFSFNDQISEFLDFFPEIINGKQITQEQFKSLEGQTCTIINLETANSVYNIMNITISNSTHIPT